MSPIVADVVLGVLCLGVFAYLTVQVWRADEQFEDFDDDLLMRPLEHYRQRVDRDDWLQDRKAERRGGYPY